MIPDSLSAASLSRRRILTAFGVLTVGAAVSACSNGDSSPTPGNSPQAGSTPTATPTAGGSIAVGMPAVSAYLNPLTATTGNIAWATEPIVETLYAWGDDFASVPLLAADLPTISDDGLTWTIPIKTGITFSNGDPFTAQHVAATLSFVSNPDAFSDWTNFVGRRITEVVAQDDETVVVTLAAPYGILQTFLTNIPMVHQDYLEQTDTTVGTGPYMIENSVQGQSLTLIRNDSYHGDSPLLDKIEYQAIPDAGTRLVNLREGRIHIMTDVPPDNVALLESDSDLTIHVVDAPISILSYFNATKAPFDDPKVRQALAHAMDRQGIRDTVYAGTAQIAQGPAGPAIEGHDPDLNIYSDTPDIARAQELLADAGVQNLEFSLMVSTNAEIRSMAQILQEGWRTAGITCTLDQTDPSTWISRFIEGDYEMSFNIYPSGISSGRTGYVLYSPYTSTNPLNHGYKNTQVDELMSQAWATSDAAEREDLSKQINALLAEDAVAVPPVYPSFIVAQRNDVAPLDQDALSVGRVRTKTAGLLG